MLTIGNGLGTAIDINSGRLKQLIDDQLNPLRAVQNYVTAFFAHSERVNIKRIRIANAVHTTATTKRDRPIRRKGSKRKKQTR